ncbi:MAG: PEGA domain-containing protein [Acidobacteriota bacterium]
MLRYLTICLVFISSLAYSQTAASNPIKSDSTTGFHSVYITSEPSGADVFINDSSFGRTPLRILNFPNKQFFLKLVDSLQNKWGLIIDDTKSKEVSIHALIAKDHGQLLAFSEPSGAEVFINDSLLGKTPLGPVRMPLGFTKVKLKKENYTSYEEIVNMPRKIPYLYKIDTKLKSIYSAVDLSALSQYRYIYLDGKKVDPLEVRKITAGEHNIRAGMQEGEPGMDLNFESDNDALYNIYVKPKQFNFRRVLYSLVIPGAGQASDGAIIKGASIFTGSALLAAASIFTSNNYSGKTDLYNKQRLAYLSSQNEMEALANRDIMLSAKDEMDKALKMKKLSIGLLAGVYIYNILDVIVFHSVKDVLDLTNARRDLKLSGSAGLNTDGVTFGIKYNF